MTPIVAGNEMENGMRDTGRAREAGFSLVELIVAMAVTLLITGAVYGLIAGGQTAFRREPELAERQQNIRLAMDLIMKDIANAGAGLPPFVQTFRPGLDACAGCPQGPDGALTDEIEIVTNSESRDTEPVCRDAVGAPTTNQTNVRLMRDTNALGALNPVNPGLVVIPFTLDGRWTLRTITAATRQTGQPAFTCTTAGNHTLLTFLNGDANGLNAVTNLPCDPGNGWGNVAPNCQIIGISFANVVRYRIRNDASVPPVPMLERWSSDAQNAFVGGLPNPAAFQVLARGIENLQVEYLRADGDPNVAASWTANAPAVVSPQFPSLITQVRVRLAARSEARNIQGSTTSATGGSAIRGTLVSSASPRATLQNLTLASPAPILWR
jgi:prepilin-type N-terminal cleavage/methylation domain-containing protein